VSEEPLLPVPDAVRRRPLKRRLAGLHALRGHQPPGAHDGLAGSVIHRLRDVG
jgi:hypothetical protein